MTNSENHRRKFTTAERVIIAINTVYITIFTAIAAARANHEFILYAAVIVVFFALLIATQRRTNFSPIILGGLTLWGVMHMAGGNIEVNDDVLYSLQLIPVVLRYDQLVHFFGFGTATLVCHHMLRPYLKPDPHRWSVLAILIVLMGMGVGALNEIIEFIAVLIVPETGVGGYDNTLWDLVFNTLGAITAAIVLTLRRRKTDHP